MNVGGVHEAGHEEHNHDHEHSHDHELEQADAAQAAQVQAESGLEMQGRHTAPGAADGAVRKHLAHYVQRAVSEGASIVGNATVVEGEDWDKAGINHFGTDRWPQYRDSINAFVDKDSKVWLHRQRGNAGTTIHEAVHVYSAKAVLYESQPLNEGITEYFTRQVCAQVHPSLRRRNYQDNFRTATKLVSYTSERAVAQAYFDGKLAELRRDFNAQHGGNAGWADFAQKCSDEKWRDAQRVMDTKAAKPKTTSLPKADFSNGNIPLLY